MKSYQVSLILSVLALVCYVGIVTAVQEGDGEGAEEIEAVADGKDVEDGKDGNFLSRFFNMFQSGQKKTEEKGVDFVETEEVPDKRNKISEHLIERSTKNSLKPEELKAIVEDKFKDELTALTNAMKENEKQPEGKRTKFAEISEIYQICQVSPDKCSPDQFGRVFLAVLSYGKYIKELTNFASHCYFVKLRDYCGVMIDDVLENLLNRVSEENKALVKPFWDKLLKEGVLDKAKGEDAYGGFSKETYESMEQTYSEIMRSKFEDGISTDQEEIFLLKFTRAVEEHYKIYDFLKTLKLEGEKNPEPKQDSTVAFMKFGITASQFFETSNRIFDKLKKRIMDGSGEPFEKSHTKFMELTEEQLIEDQKRRKAVAESERQSPN